MVLKGWAGFSSSEQKGYWGEKGRPVLTFLERRLFPFLASSFLPGPGGGGGWFSLTL